MSLTRFISKRTLSKFISTSRLLSSSSSLTNPISFSPKIPTQKPFFNVSRYAHTSSQQQNEGPTTQTLAASDEESETDANMNEFLSRFVWIMRKKLLQAVPDCDKLTVDGMLLVIVEKVVLEMEKEKSGLGKELDGGRSDDFSPDLWRTVWEVSNEVLSDMKTNKKKEMMKGFLHNEEVKEMYRFAGEIGVRGDLLRELRFKWAREKMEESEFISGVERLCDEEKKVLEGKESGVKEIGVGEKSVMLPKRHGKVKYKIYGLNLSDSKWSEVADKIHESGKLMWPEEAKPITGKCKLVMEKIMALNEEDDHVPLLEEWKALLKPSRIEWIALLDRLKEQSPHLYFMIAEHVLSEESFETKVHDYSRLIDAYATENHFEDAERILKKMKENGISPDVVMLIGIIHMYCKSGSFSKAKEAYNSLIACGFQPDMKVYSSMIVASASAGDPNFGLRLIDEMERRDLKPTLELYMSLLRSFSQKGEWLDEAKRVSSSAQMAGFQQTLESYTLMIEAHIQTEGGLSEARAHFDHMIRSGHKPDDRCVASMISGYEKKNELANALDLLLGLEKEGFSPGVRTYTTFVDWFAKMELVDEVEQMLDKIAKLGDVPPLKLHVSLCDMYSKMGSEKKALQALGVLESKSEHMGHEDFERVIESLAKAGFTEDASKMIGLMEARGFKASEPVLVSLRSFKTFRKGHNLGKRTRFGRDKQL